MQPDPTDRGTNGPWQRPAWPSPRAVGEVGRCDVAVVGAGVAGTLVALGLAQAGARVALIDPAPGGGAAARGAGLVSAGLSEHPARLELALGTERAAAVYGLADRSADLLEAMGVPLARADQVWAATAPDEEPWIERSVAALHRMGRQAHALDADGLAARGVRAALGFVTPGDAALDDPAVALARLGQLAVDAGVVWLAGRVRAAEAADGALAVILDAGRVRAEMIVWATGASPVEPTLVPLVWPVREQAIAVPLPVAMSAVGRAGHGWTSFRGTGTGAIVTGCRWASPHLDVGETDPVPTPAVQHQLDAFAARLGAGPATARWAWIAAHSCDGLPLVGPLPGDPRRSVCTGFGGHDWALGPASAASLVDGLVGATTAPVPWLAPSRMG